MAKALQVNWFQACDKTSILFGGGRVMGTVRPQVDKACQSVRYRVMLKQGMANLNFTWADSDADGRKMVEKYHNIIEL